MSLLSVNPATGQLLRRFEPLTPEALEARLALAAAAARTYPAESLADRAFWMRRLALLLDDDAEELAALITAEMGKTLAAARAEVAKCADTCRYFASHAAQLLEPEALTPSAPLLTASLRWDPIGVVLAIMPWNFPLWQVFRFLAPALMAGNVALLKHAPTVPQCALAMEALVRRAGFPRGVFQSLLIETSQVEGVLSDARVAAVTLTGSVDAGRAVAAQAGWLVKKSVLELGGSDAFIVLPSANLEAAVSAAVAARCINNGQSCIAAKRFLVHTEIYEAFEQRFTAAMAAQRVGDPMLATTDVGPLATPQLVAHLHQQTQAAVAAGGRVLTGGEPLPGPGNFFPPTVVAGVDPAAAVASEETFGPLALLFRVDSLEHAMALANATPFGLGASAWTADPAEQQHLAAGLQCGGVFFNTPVASDPRLPFGGVKQSGYGRELSTLGLREFLNAKTVVTASAVPLPSQPLLFASQVAAPLPARFAAPIAPPAAMPAPQAAIPLPPAPAPTAPPPLPPPPPPPPTAAPAVQTRPLPSEHAGEFRLPPLPGYEPREAPQLKPLDTGEFRLPPLPGYEPREAPQLKPLNTGEFRLPPLEDKRYTGPMRLKPLDTGEFRLPPLDGVETHETDYDDDDEPPMRGSILGLR